LAPTKLGDGPAKKKHCSVRQHSRLINGHQNKTNNFSMNLKEYTEENWDAVVETNLKGTFLTCQVIVNIPWRKTVKLDRHNSFDVQRGGAESEFIQSANLGCPAAYSLRKAALEACRNIFPRTGLQKACAHQINRTGSWKITKTVPKKNFANFSPLQRMSYNHEIAAQPSFLLSDAASYVTGITCSSEGGWTLVGKKKDFLIFDCRF